MDLIIEYAKKYTPFGKIIRAHKKKQILIFYFANEDMKKQYMEAYKWNHEKTYLIKMGHINLITFNPREDSSKCILKIPNETLDLRSRREFQVMETDRGGGRIGSQ